MIAPFGNQKEEATKFNVSGYHKGNLCLPDLVEITPKLISSVIGLLSRGDPVPVSSNNPASLEDLTSNQATKNYKGVMIIHIINMIVKWASINFSIYLMNSSQSFNVKKVMLEEASNSQAY